jgi:hypothetical protein
MSPGIAPIFFMIWLMGRVQMAVSRPDGGINSGCMSQNVLIASICSRVRWAGQLGRYLKPML